MAKIVSAEELLTFIEPSAMRIETLTPTAWGGHIPFMFCVMKQLRPRIYVELGTHHGASFFAACQAIRKFDIDCSPTAIDLWIGDEHAGKYDESVYKNFTWLLQERYSGIGKVLRKDFNDAVADFGDGSIDLLHIDGLHTYEAVKNDYDTWLPKMSEKGVILFHDTVVMERGFGVWRLWGEIKDLYTSFNFSHTHGLGIIALGTEQMNPLISILNGVNQSTTFQKAFDSYFSLNGERAVSEAMGNSTQDPPADARTLGLATMNFARRLRSRLAGR
jgi:hypothetical protein